MYEVIYENELWWISKDGRILEDMGSFIDPISPKLIVEAINGELQL